jgi:hypothetical protein
MLATLALVNIEGFGMRHGDDFRGAGRTILVSTST